MESGLRERTWAGEEKNGLEILNRMVWEKWE